MENLLENSFVILVLVIAAALWILYHQIFHVIYFGNGFNAMFREFVVCFVISLLIVSFGVNFLAGVVTAIGSALGFIGSLLLGLIKIVLVILAALAVIAVIGAVLKKLGIVKDAPAKTMEPAQDEKDFGEDQNPADDVIPDQDQDITE